MSEPLVRSLEHRLHLFIHQNPKLALRLVRSLAKIRPLALPRAYRKGPS